MARLTARILALAAVLGACTIGDRPPPADDAAPSAEVCSGGRFRCFARTRTRVDRTALVAPHGYGPPELTAAYNLDTSVTVDATIAVIAAYAYPELESDLAFYRNQFGLPSCTIASGCLTVVNQRGETSSPPAPAPNGDDWPQETALDVQMVSAACPSCKILVVQADDDLHDGLILANDTAAMLGASVISNSWGTAEGSASDVVSAEVHFDHPGVAIFAAAGDHGFDHGGPTYPATSAHTIAVGGTTLKAAANARGWSERAWDDGGSSCSGSVPKPSWQTSDACMYRMSTDLAAVGDVDTGVAVFIDGDDGWQVVGGTSVAAPLVAAIFAQTGHAAATAELAYQSAGGFFDIIAGTNGSCDANAILCNAGAGWDAPTGNGTPNGAVLTGAAAAPTLTVSAPFDGDVVPPGFPIAIACASTDAAAVQEVDVAIDSVQIGALTAPPFTIAAPMTYGNGVHSIAITCTTAAIAQTSALVTVTQSPACTTDPDCTTAGDVCYAGACIAGASLSNGLGATCTMALECASQDCAPYGAASVCSVACDPAAAACPGGFVCVAGGDRNDGSAAAQCLPAPDGGCAATGDGPPIALCAGVLALLTAASARSRPARSAARRCARS